jgi:hypothetical protein
MPKLSILIAGLLLTLSSVQAEVISIADPRYDVPNSGSGVLRPTQGMNMNQVEQKFGAPESKVAAVGEPPISRWVYPEFSVFFEYDKVIHSVIKRDDQ